MAGKIPDYRIRKKISEDEWIDAGAVWVNKEKDTLGISLNLGALGKINLTAIRIKEKGEEYKETAFGE